METIYGPSGSHSMPYRHLAMVKYRYMSPLVITRMQVLKASDDAFAKAEASFGQDVSSTGPPIAN